MAGQFDVDPEGIKAFATNLDSIVAQLETSKGVLGNVHFDPLVFGIVGQIFAAAARVEVKKAEECIGKYESGLREAAKNARLTADTYTNTDQGNAKTFSGGA
ncbi:type VII secretion target [Lentzea sp. NPDC060358]|uniref:type VII secretion target n=1 Tax=Lentzea sp. NPDC060358 TaxID=3347103 RepID=UPI00366761E9